MRLSVEWIKEYAAVDAEADELASTLTMAGLEVEETEPSARGPVLNITVTPNRGDCLSTVGVAREVAAAYNVPVAVPAVNPSGDSREAAGIARVTVEDQELCARYAARIIRSLRPVPSPGWMQERLTAAGMRPISGIVDVTNYVMLELGQPLHAFDFDRLKGGEIIVRRARPGERLQTLDGVDRELTPDMLMICDASGPVAVAGVMGGGPTECNLRTKTALLESARFHPLSVRRTARKLGLHTEASMRFERTVDPQLVALAADRACTLIAQLGMGEVVPGIVDFYQNPQPERRLTLRPERASLLLGFEVSADESANALRRLGFRVTDGHPLTVAVPSRRPDIVREADLVEEVGRVLGYERIPERLPHGSSTQGGDSRQARFAGRVRELLSGAGLQEVVSHSLLAPSPFEDDRRLEQRIAIRSALSAELSGLRRSLLPGLADALERNARRSQGPLAFFEVGRVFHRNANGYDERLTAAGLIAGPLLQSGWQRGTNAGPADFYTARGLVERVLAALHVGDHEWRRSDDPRLHPGRSAEIQCEGVRIGVAGELHPDLARELTTRERAVHFELDLQALESLASMARRFVPPSHYPSVVRDLAPRVDASLPYDAVERAVRAVGSPFLQRFVLTDVFAGDPLPEGVRSLTLSFTFRAADRTLTDEETASALQAIRARLEADCGATFPA